MNLISRRNGHLFEVKETSLGGVSNAFDLAERCWTPPLLNRLPIRCSLHNGCFVNPQRKTLHHGNKVSTQFHRFLKTRVFLDNSKSSSPTRWQDPSSMNGFRGPATLTPKQGSSTTRAAPYLDERDRDFDQLPKRRETKSFSDFRRGPLPTITHTPSGPRMEGPGGGMRHNRSQSCKSGAVFESLNTDRRTGLRWAPDSVLQGRQGSSVTSQLSEIAPDQSLCNRLSTGLTRVKTSQLADLPNRGSCFTRTPESSPELPTTPTFSKILHSDSSPVNVDSMEKDRIRFEQSRKLIPVMSTQANHRKALKGKKTNSVNLLYYQGVVSPVKKQEPASVAIGAHPSFQRKDQQLNQSKKQVSGMVESRPEQDQPHRTAFYRSLKNKPVSKVHHRPDSEFSNLLQRSVSESCMMLTTTTTTPVCLPISNDPNGGGGGGVKAFGDEVAPPSTEEEEFLRQLGWKASSKASIITDEEIAEFRASSRKRNFEKKKDIKKQDSKKPGFESSGFRSYQSSPVGHLSSYDIVVDDGTSDDANFSESGRSL